MPTWQRQRTEAARRAELFGGRERGWDEVGSGPGTRGPARGSSSLPVRSNHTGSNPETLGGDRTPSSRTFESQTTWTRMTLTQGVAAGVRPRGYFDAPVASPGDNRNSVDSNSSNLPSNHLFDPPSNPSFNPSSASTFVQKRMVHRAVQQHQGTTASAERSLAVAENCLDIGVTTLEEVSRQGEGLDKTERGLDMVCACCRHGLWWS